MENQFDSHLSDSQLHTCRHLRSKFADTANIRAVHYIDISGSDITLAKPKLIEVFDTLIAINVTEYGYFSKPVIENFQVLLKPGGRLIIIVPAFTAIYAGLEENLDEWKDRKSVV